MSTFFKQYKGLFMNHDQLQTSNYTHPNYEKDNVFQKKLQRIQDKLQQSENKRFPRFSFNNPESDILFNQENNHSLNRQRLFKSFKDYNTIQIPQIKDSIKQIDYPKTKTQASKQFKSFSYPSQERQILKLPSIDRPHASSSIDNYSYPIKPLVQALPQRSKTQSDIYFSPQIRRHQKRHKTMIPQSTNNIFLNFSQYRKPQINNYQLLDKRMHDLSKVNNYHHPDHINDYTQVLIRRRDIKKDPKRREKLKQILSQQEKDKINSYGYENLKQYSKL